jgi:hypothetical protein
VLNREFNAMLPEQPDDDWDDFDDEDGDAMTESDWDAWGDDWGDFGADDDDMDEGYLAYGAYEFTPPSFYQRRILWPLQGWYYQNVQTCEVCGKRNKNCICDDGTIF